jgi:hypothetical protein
MRGSASERTPADEYDDSTAPIRFLSVKICPQMLADRCNKPTNYPVSFVVATFSSEQNAGHDLGQSITLSLTESGIINHAQRTWY